MSDKNQAILWARRIVEHPYNYVILDTETAGLNREVIDLAIIGPRGEGNVIFNSRFCPLGDIEPGATAIHHLTRENLATAPTWNMKRDEIAQAIGTRTVVIYNARFDTARIFQTCQLHMVTPITFRSTCAMEWYAQFFGDWDDYHQSYRWQKLEGGDHTALGDCFATLKLIKRMAAIHLEPESYDPDADPSPVWPDVEGQDQA